MGFLSLPSHAFWQEPAFCSSLCITTPALRCFSVFPLFPLSYSTKIQALCRLRAALCPRTTLFQIPSHKVIQWNTESACYNATPPRVLAALPSAAEQSVSKLSPVKFLLPEWKISGTSFHEVTVKWKQRKLTEPDVLFWKPWPSM